MSTPIPREREAAHESFTQLFAKLPEIRFMFISRPALDDMLNVTIVGHGLFEIEQYKGDDDDGKVLCTGDAEQCTSWLMREYDFEPIPPKPLLYTCNYCGYQWKPAPGLDYCERCVEEDLADGDDLPIAHSTAAIDDDDFELPF